MGAALLGILGIKNEAVGRDQKTKLLRLAPGRVFTLRTPFRLVSCVGEGLVGKDTPSITEVMGLRGLRSPKVCE